MTLFASPPRCPECGGERGWFGPCPRCGADAPKPPAMLFRDVLRDCANAASLHVSRCRSESQWDLIPYYEGRRDAFLEVLTHLEEYPEDAMPADLAAVLHDPTVVLDRDKEVRLADGSTLHDALERWRNAPSDTASADLGDR